MCIFLKDPLRQNIFGTVTISQCSINVYYVFLNNNNNLLKRLTNQSES